MHTFQPIWYTIPEFSDAKPISVYHKENAAPGKDRPEDSAAVWKTLRNLHVLARAEFDCPEAGDGDDCPEAQDSYCGPEAGDHSGGSEAKGRFALRITADDYYKLYVNGTFLAQGPAPGYPEHYYYNTLDITPYLRKGRNVAAVHLYYQGLINRVWNSGDGRFGVASDLTDLQNGNMVQLQWKYHISSAYSGETTGYDTQYLENFDSRKWDEDWNQPFYENHSWNDMAPAVWADYQLCEQPVKQLDVYRIQPAQVIVEPEAWFVDMGREITGSLKLRAAGGRGDRIIIRCGEECEGETQDGGARGEEPQDVEPRKGKGRDVRSDMRCNCRYEEVWTLDEGVCALEPYDYKGFRYARLIPDRGVRILNVEGLVRHYPMDEALCTLKSSSRNLDDIFTICKNGVRLGTQEGYLDCPTREKGQYLGDALVTARSQVWLTGSVEMLRKCIDQFARTKSICPGLMAVAPGSFMQEVADFSLLWLELLLTDYQFTGDKEFLKTYYPTARGILEHFSQYSREDGLLVQVGDKWNLVDWPENLRDGYDFELSRPVVAPGCHNVINALYIGAAGNLTKIEQILGIEPAMDWNGLRKAYVKAFYRKDQKLFADSETSRHCAIHSNIYALYYGLAPGEAVAAIGDELVSRGLACGVLVSFFYLKALARSGRHRELFQALVNESVHGWVNMLKEGATACFEAWGKEQKWNTSLCHPWASAPISVFIEEIAGFVPDPERALGFRLDAHIPEELEHFTLKLPFRGNGYEVRWGEAGPKILKYYRISEDMSMEEIEAK